MHSKQTPRLLASAAPKRLTYDELLDNKAVLEEYVTKLARENERLLRIIKSMKMVVELLPNIFGGKNEQCSDAGNPET